MNSDDYKSKIEELQIELQQHPMYQRMRSVDDMRQFMQVHVFAVWDFMSLLKRLQQDITCMTIPWLPSSYSKKAVRLINEIVCAEESDDCPLSIHSDGYCDHFSIYLMAMREVGISDVVYFEQLKHLNFSVLPPRIKNFLAYHIQLAAEGRIEQVAGSFLFGREQLLPSLFKQVVEQIKVNSIPCPALEYYLERHIEVDGEHHSHMSRELFHEICHTEEKLILGYEAALASLEQRKSLWDQALENMRYQKNEKRSTPS